MWRSWHKREMWEKKMRTIIFTFLLVFVTFRQKRLCGHKISAVRSETSLTCYNKTNVLDKNLDRIRIQQSLLVYIGIRNPDQGRPTWPQKMKERMKIFRVLKSWMFSLRGWETCYGASKSFLLVLEGNMKHFFYQNVFVFFEFFGYGSWIRPRLSK